MPLATKNGSLIVKDGSIAENCNCCAGGWYCSTGCCTDLTTGLYAQSASCDCTGPTKHYSADWSNASGGCAPCAFLFPYNVSVTVTYTGPPPVSGMSEGVVAASNGTRTYSPLTCNGSLFGDLLSFGMFPIVWYPDGIYNWGPLSFNYENAGGGQWRQVIWMIGWGIAPATANSDFRYKISHDCSGPEASWSWINGLSLSYDTVYRRNNTLISGGNLSLVFNSFDTLKVSANATNLGSWVRRC